MEMLDRPSQLPVDEGESPDKPFSGDLEFKQVEFSYADRKFTKVLEVSTSTFKFNLFRASAEVRLYGYQFLNALSVKSMEW